MHYVLLSVICSVSVSVLIKYARQKNINNLQMFVWNYPCAIFLSYFLLSPHISDISIHKLPVFLLLSLAFLLFALFIVIIHSIRTTGIAKTEVAQRLSLFIPLLAAYFIFGERLGIEKISGVILGFMAIFLCLYQNKKAEVKSDESKILYPVIVFIGMGIIDVLFKKIAQIDALPYSSLLFILFVFAFFFAFLYLLYLLFIKRESLDKPAIAWGIAMGALNFGNILFYLKAHQYLPENPSIVFTAMNIGVIIVGALVGVFLFHEQLNKLNKIGILLAILSVIVIAYA